MNFHYCFSLSTGPNNTMSALLLPLLLFLPLPTVPHINNSSGSFWTWQSSLRGQQGVWQFEGNLRQHSALKYTKSMFMQHKNCTLADWRLQNNVWLLHFKVTASISTCVFIKFFQWCTTHPPGLFGLLTLQYFL